MSTIIRHTIHGWSALDGNDTTGYELIASADTIDGLLPLLRELGVITATVELREPRARPPGLAGRLMPYVSDEEDRRILRKFGDRDYR